MVFIFECLLHTSHCSPLIFGMYNFTDLCLGFLTCSTGAAQYSVKVSFCYVNHSGFCDLYLFPFWVKYEMGVDISKMAK